MEVVLVDTVRRGRLADMAGAAREHQLVIDAVLLGVEQIGALETLARRSRAINVPPRIKSRWELGQKPTIHGRT